jgi:hypothetical protein
MQDAVLAVLHAKDSDTAMSRSLMVGRAMAGPAWGEYMVPSASTIGI